MKEYNNQQRLSHGQKTGFVLLLLFAVLTVGLTFFQLRNTIYSPFVVRISPEDIAASEALQFDENTRLQQIDTDQDGLNDYEELYFYETSPYIPDTDSDGIDDKEEIDTGKDPLCPEGQSCSAEEYETGVASSTVISPLVNSVETPEDVVLNSQPDLDVSAIATSTEELAVIASSPELIRQILLSTGKLTEEELSQIDDETLMAMAQELLKNNSNQVTTNDGQ